MLSIPQMAIFVDRPAPITFAVVAAFVILSAAGVIAWRPDATSDSLTPRLPLATRDEGQGYYYLLLTTCCVL